MIFTTPMLYERYRQYRNPQSKIKRLVEKGELFPLTRGIYETDPNVSGCCLAGAICGPSYLSFEYALSVYDLIPETVYTFTSATFEKKKAKEYENRFGRFSYRDVPSEAFPYGIVLREENGYTYRIAAPEKALCDKLYTTPPVNSQKEIAHLLFEDLRIDRQQLLSLDTDAILQIGAKYHSSNVNYLIKYLRRNGT